MEGQTSPTVTRSKLFEVSVVDIGSNDDAIVLTKDGKQITLGRDGECPLPLLSEMNDGVAQQSEQAPLRSLARHFNNDYNHQNKEDMDIVTLALQLGLPETATEAEVNAKLAELQAAKKENDTLAQQLKAAKDSNDALVLASITAMVDAAIGEKKVGADKKQHFIELGKQVGAESLKTTLDAMAPQVKLTQALQDGKTEGGTATSA